MANRPTPITQANATRYFKAAATAGYGRTRLVMHPDGRVEVIAEIAETTEAFEGPLEAWRRNGQG